MDENIYILPDKDICRRIGKKIRELRLRQDLTQSSLAEQAQISVSSVKKIERGEIGSFDSFLRLLRILGELDIFSPLLTEIEMSPNEYLEFVEASRKNRKQRASSPKNQPIPNTQELSEW